MHVIKRLDIVEDKIKKMIENMEKRYDEDTRLL